MLIPLIVTNCAYTKNSKQHTINVSNYVSTKNKQFIYKKTRGWHFKDTDPTKYNKELSKQVPEASSSLWLPPAAKLPFQIN